MEVNKPFNPPIPTLVKKIHPDAIIPVYATEDSAGFDLVAVQDMVIIPQGCAVIPTGLAVSIYPGFEIQIRPRSGISLKTKLRLPNSPGTIDADYRGEIGVIMENTNPVSPYVSDYFLSIKGEKITLEGFEGGIPMGSYFIRKGDRIAQGVLAAVRNIEFIDVGEEKLPTTERGAGGFGSTGTK